MWSIIGILVSFVYYFGLLFISKLFKSNLEYGRKFVHIMLGNWWFLALIFFDSVFTAIIVPFSFIFVNYISLKRNKKGGLLSELERKNGKKSYGIVAYPIAMTMLVIVSYSVIRQPYIGGIGLFALAYGDGFATIIGQKYNYKPMVFCGNVKTLSGSLSMFCATFLSTFIYVLIVSGTSHMLVIIPSMLLVALISTLFELFTPFGLDNITVPLAATGTFYMLNSLLNIL
jgi:phytol kinase